ncbi:hypothetical protein [Pelagicoccus sp. SDUM812002]|uniref:hypothetical protein n=1 Tax=Pelagicoccus sp. SDUM812002 TaxID=3041266 RepID=UPI00280F3E59|nr:hypothetical protein [Pelagicoccus sp. SDUM812002]MDQ8188213.1 hypothetical protein [Pelagicoccus sp. SDUM812002]
MRFDFPPPRTRLPLMAALLLLNLPHAQADLHDWYRANDPASFPFSAGSISSEASGYSLNASATFRKSETNTIESSSHARIDASGRLLWTLTSATPSIEFQSDSASPEHAFAYRSDVQHLELVRINSSDLSSSYSIKYPFAAESAQTELTFLPNSRVGILQNRGSSQQFAVFAPDGSLVFENKYTSSGFLSIAPDADSSQSARLHSTSGGDHYYLTIHKSLRNQSKSTFNNTFFVLSINNSGTLNWSRAFAIETVSRTIDLSCVVDDDLLVALPDTTVGVPGQPFSSVPSTHLACLSSSGSLSFTQTLEGFSYGGSPVIRDGNSLLLAGSSPNSGVLFATDAALARLSTADGSLTQQAGFDALETETLQLVGINAQRCFATLTSQAQGAEPKIHLSLDSSLQATAAKSASGSVLQLDAQSQAYLSTYLPSRAAVGAIELDSSLTPPSATEIDLAEATITPVDPNIHAANLGIDLLELNVSTQASTTATTTANLNYAPLSLEHYRGHPETISSPIAAAMTVHEDSSLSLSFDSEYGFDYHLQRGDSPDGSFSTIDSLSGTGEPIRFSTTTQFDSPIFYRILKSDPHNEIRFSTD